MVPLWTTWQAQDRVHENHWEDQLIYGTDRYERYLVSRCDVPSNEDGAPEGYHKWNTDVGSAEWQSLERLFGNLEEAVPCTLERFTRCYESCWDSDRNKVLAFWSEKVDPSFPLVG